MKKIVIIGPESTGKSTLCSSLADHFGSLWVPEYARDFLHHSDAKYDYDDLLTIAKGQIDLEEKIATKNQKVHPGKPLFIDTDLYVMKVWCEFVFGKCHKWILEQIVDRKYDLYLLCDIDLPWTFDKLREYPEEAPRQQLYKMYLDLMMNQSTPFEIISGSTEERFQKAVGAHSRLLK